MSQRALVAVVAAQSAMIVALTVALLARREAATAVTTPASHEIPAAVAPPSEPEGGAAPSIPRGAVVPAETESSGELETFVVHGTITDADGNAVNQVTGWLLPEDPGAEPRSFWVGVREYAVAGIEPGRFTLRCSAPEYRDAVVPIELSRPATVRRVDVRLERAGTIAIRFLTPDGRPLAAALDEAGFGGHLSVVATPEALVRFQRVPSNSSVGVYRVGEARERGAAGPDGFLELKTDPPLHASVVWDSLVVASEFVPAPVGELSIVVSLDTFGATRGSIRFRVVDGATRAPLEGVLVQSSTGGSVVTAGDGRVELTDVACGSHLFDLAAAGSYKLLDGGSVSMWQGPPGSYKLQRKSLPLAPGQSIDAGDVPLFVSCTLRGVVRDANGAPASSYFWCVPRGLVAGPDALHVADRFSRDGVESFRSSEEDGTFELTVSPGSYVLFPSDRDSVRMGFPVEVPREGLDGFEITLSTGTAVRLCPDPALLARELRLIVEDEDGIEVLIVDELDRFVSRHPVTLAPGRHAVRLMAGDAVFATEYFTVGPTPFDLPLK